MKIHMLKTDPAVFAPAALNTKRYEIRVDDRGIVEGDTLVLCETTADRATLTGKNCSRVVQHVLRGPCYGLAEGWAIFSIRPLTNIEKLALATESAKFALGDGAAQ